MVSPSAIASPGTAIDERRERLFKWLQLAFAVIGGLLFAAIMWGLLTFSPRTGRWTVSTLALLVPFSDKIERLLGIGAAEYLAATIVAFVAGAWLAWTARGTIRWAADSLFPPFDSELLRPIRRPGILDPLWLPAIGAERGMQPLSWVTPPLDSPRRAVWDALIEFLSRDVGDGRLNLLGHPSSSFVRFDWTVLTGRPGSGKTRMATEIARGRARRELLGDESQETRSDRRRLSLGTWLRLIWPFAARRESALINNPIDAPWSDADPWDAGWLSPTSRPGGLRHADRSRFDEGLLHRLRAWRPRRPTVLILDDPRHGDPHQPGDANSVITALLAGEARYRHPVRLIVISQTLPEDLGFELHADGSWSPKIRGFVGPILSLDGTMSLSAGEVRLLCGVMRSSGHLSGWKPTDENVRRLLRRTRANALLVCLELQWIRRHRDAEMASIDDLLLDRAERIIEALKVAAVGTREHLRAVALATLASGMEGATPDIGSWAVDWPRFEPDQITALPNLDISGPPPMPPMVRPEPIGDAFVRLVLSNRLCDGETRERVISAAWRVNPRGVLDVARRRSASTDEVAIILRRGPPAASGLDPIELAVAYASAAILIERADWDVGEASWSGRAVWAALRRIQSLSPEQAASVFLRLVDRLAVSNAIAIVRGRAALLCISVVIQRSLDNGTKAWQAPEAAAQGRSRLIRFFDLLQCWGINRHWSRHILISRVVSKFVSCVTMQSGALATEEWLSELAWAAWRAQWHAPDVTKSALLALTRAPPECTGMETVVAARRHRFATMVTAAANDTAGCEAAAKQVDALVQPFAGGRDFELEHARAWCYVSYAHNDIAGREAAAKYVDALAQPFAGDRDFELERTRAWHYAKTIRSPWFRNRKPPALSRRVLTSDGSERALYAVANMITTAIVIAPVQTQPNAQALHRIEIDEVDEDPHQVEAPIAA